MVGEVSVVDNAASVVTTQIVYRVGKHSGIGVSILATEHLPMP